MKKIATINLILIGLFSYGQESLFTDLNKKGHGTFHVTAQYFWMHRSDMVDFSNNDYIKHDNSSSIAFTLNYESPKYKGFSVNLSYLETFQFQEYAFPDNNVNGAKAVQNDSFRFLNNLSLNYSFGFSEKKDGRIVLGTFPLDLEFMTRYPIRQKEQAYQGMYIDFPKLGNWSIKAGHITQFSSWKTNRGDINFQDVKLGFNFGGNNITYLSNGQSFAEASYNEDALFFAAYYTRFHTLVESDDSSTKLGVESSLDVLGFSFLEELATINPTTKLSLRAKGTYQWGQYPLGNVFAIQPGLMLSQNTFSLEAGFFAVKGDMEIQNPFAARWIIAEPLWEIDFQREENSGTFYLESLYRFDRGKIYALYMRTTNPNTDATYQVMEEYNIIATCELKKRWNAGVKLAFFRGDRHDESIRHLLDARLVLNYSF